MLSKTIWLFAVLLLIAAPLRAQVKADKAGGGGQGGGGGAGASGVVDTRPEGKLFGLGLSLGGPTGLAGKYHLTPSSGVQFGVGIMGHGWLSLYADYVFSPVAFINNQHGSLFPYLGGGVGMGLLGNTGWTPYYYLPFNFFSADLHLLAGLGWAFKSYPFDLFLEIAPGVQFVPGFGLGWHGFLGGRYYF